MTIPAIAPPLSPPPDGDPGLAAMMLGSAGSGARVALAAGAVVVVVVVCVPPVATSRDGSVVLFTG
jgi:hypothetical protein